MVNKKISFALLFILCALSTALVGIMPQQQFESIHISNVDIFSEINGLSATTTVSFTLHYSGNDDKMVELFLPVQGEVTSVSHNEGVLPLLTEEKEVAQFLTSLIQIKEEEGVCLSHKIKSPYLISCASMLEFVSGSLISWSEYMISGESKNISITFTQSVKSQGDFGDATYTIIYPMLPLAFRSHYNEDITFSADLVSSLSSKQIFVKKISPQLIQQEHRILLSKDKVTPWSDISIEYSLIIPIDNSGKILFSALPSINGLSKENENLFYMLFSARAEIQRLADSVIKQIPKDIVVLVDSSGSMSGNKINDARDAARSAVESIDSQDTIKIITFSDTTHTYSGSKNTLYNAIDLIYAGGGTNLYDGLSAAIKTLSISPHWYSSFLVESRSDNKDTTRLKIIVLLSDGQPTVGVTGEDAIVALGKKAEAASISISTIGFGSDVNARLLRKIAESTGGAYYYSEDNDFLNAFHEELNRAKAQSLSNVNIKLEFGSEVELKGVYGQESSWSDSTVKIPLYRLMNGEEKSFEVELSAKPPFNTDIVTIVSKISVEFFDPVLQKTIEQSYPAIALNVLSSDKAIIKRIEVINQAQLDKIADLSYKTEELMREGAFDIAEEMLAEINEKHKILAKNVPRNQVIAQQAIAAKDSFNYAKGGSAGSQLTQNRLTTNTYSLRTLSAQELMQNVRQTPTQALSNIDNMWVTGETIEENLDNEKITIVYGCKHHKLDEEAALNIAQGLEAVKIKNTVICDTNVQLSDSEKYIFVGGPRANSKVSDLEHSYNDWYFMNRGGRGSIYTINNSIVVAGLTKEDTQEAGALLVGLFHQ